MKDHTAQPTQDTKAGTSETNSKQVRLKKKTSHIKEVEATVHDDGKVTYSDEAGEEKAYVIDSTEDFRFAMGEAQLTGKKNLEVSHRLFDHLTLGKPTPYIIYGNPAVKIYREGTMDQIEKLESLDVEDLIELKAKKARKIAVEEKARKDKIKAEIEL
jgi:hypothetical protein